MQEIIYLDHCATTPLDPAVEAAMAEARAAAAGNASSVHGPGRASRALLSEARGRIAARLDAAPDEIIFTASGSEANNLAIQGSVLRSAPAPFHLVISALEHPSVLATARYLAGRLSGVRLTEVRPGPDGRVEPEAIERACADGVDLICLMAINNETGVMQPVEAVGEIARRHRALFHVDAVQALGRLPIRPQAWGAHFLSASAHKVHGPKGVGLLYARRGVPLEPLIHGGHQESGRRAGTEPVEAIVGCARAVELADDALAAAAQLRRLESSLLETLDLEGLDYVINGAPEFKVPGVLNLSVPDVASDDLVVGLDLEGVAISAGAACSSGVIEASHVLRAMGLDPWRVRGGVRISFGRGNTVDEARRAARTFLDVCSRLRAERRPVPGSAR